MNSLVQQRLAFERARIIGWFEIALGAFGVVFAASTRMELWWSVIFWLIFGLVWLALGVRKLRSSARAKAEFERTHGPEAGTQH